MQMTLPLIIHDLHDSQMFALAQAAGRAGIPVLGTFWPMEGWSRSHYLEHVVAIQCLSEQLKGTYALQLKDSGLAGVWLPCVDDLAEFTAIYQQMLRNIGMRFITVDIETMQAAFATETLPDNDLLKIAPMEIVKVGDLYDHAGEREFPLMIKSERDGFQVFADAGALRVFLESQKVEDNRDQYHRVQKYIEGGVKKMASAILLFDEDSRPGRGFTGRRLRVADTVFGPYGETTAARAEWIPEIYEGAKELLSSLKWKGFAEVECKQAADGQWYVMEINPRLSGWSCLAEADGAGFLSAYYQMCANDVRLEEACLQRSRSEYVRMIGTCYHDPDWAVERQGNHTLILKLRELIRIVREYRKKRAYMILGAWDDRDFAASLSIFWSTLKRVWKKNSLK
ncbi:MAG: hypothetical protein ACE5E3_02185 [Mariprofundus sp.]